MAAPTVVGSAVVTKETTSVTSFTVNLPASPVTGNLLLVILAQTDNAATPYHSMTGWNEIGEVGNNGTNASESVSVAYWREVDGAETASYEIVTTSSSSRSIAVCIEINNATDSSPIDTSLLGETDDGAITPFVVGEVTTTAADCLVIGYASASTSNLTWGAPSAGWTELVDDSQLYAASLFVGYKTMSGSGATGDLTVTPSSTSEGTWGQIAIAPVAGAASTPKGPLGHPFQGPFGGPLG